MISLFYPHKKKLYSYFMISPYEKRLIMFHQWAFQEPKLEVPTIYKAYIKPM